MARTGVGADKRGGPPRALPGATPPEAPARRLEDTGVGALSARELIALVLSNDSNSAGAHTAAAALADRFGRDGHPRLGSIGKADVAEVARTAGVGRPAAARLLAGIELGMRAARECARDRVRLTSARDVYERMLPRVRDLCHEEFWLLILDTQHRILRETCVARGLLDEAPIHPREVFRLAIAEAAASVVVVHNHPGGEPAPSYEDDGATEGLVAAGHIIGICVIDHIIVGDGSYYSYNEEGRIPPPPVRTFAWRTDARLREDLLKPRRRR